MARARSLAFAALGCATLGCANEPQTCKLDTDALVMWVNVADVEGEVAVEVEFEPEDGTTSLELCPGRDELFVNGVEAQQLRAFGHYYYDVDFASPEPSYTVTLRRGDGVDVEVEIEAPPSFEITAPEPDSTHSRGADFDIEWAPIWPDSVMEVSLLDGIGSSCIEGIGIGDEVEDLGMYRVLGGDLVGGEGAQDCEVALVLTRTRISEYPAELHPGGELRASVARGMPLISSP